jgi:hypothetical protein
MMKFEQRGHFLDAGRAPSGPEAEQHHAAAVAGQMNGGSAIGDSEVRGWLAGLGRARAPVATGRQGQEEKQTERKVPTEPHIFIIRSESA